MLLKLIRNALGFTIAGVDVITRPKPLQRTSEAQQKVDAETANMALYQFTACPFCIKTRRAIAGLGLTIETRNANNEGTARSELQAQGGKIQVPCLRISQEGEDDIWMYESKAIIEYLQQRFA